MNIEESLDRLKCLDPSDFDYNAVDGSYVDAVLKARDVLLTAYEKEKEKNKELIDKIKKMLKELEDRENKQPVIGYWSKKAMLEKIIKGVKG